MPDEKPATTNIDEAFDLLKAKMNADPTSPAAVLTKAVEDLAAGQKVLADILNKAVEETEDENSEEEEGDDDSSSDEGPENPEDQEPGVEDNLGKAVSDILAKAGVTLEASAQEDLVKAILDVMPGRAMDEYALDVTEAMRRQELRNERLAKSVEAVAPILESLMASQKAQAVLYEDLRKSVDANTATLAKAQEVPLDRTPAVLHNPVVIGDGGRHGGAPQQSLLAEPTLAKALAKGVMLEAEYMNYKRSGGSRFSTDDGREAQVRASIASL